MKAIVLGFLLIVGVLYGSASPAHATTGYWTSGSVHPVARSQTLGRTVTSACLGYTVPITVAGNGDFTDTCVYGNPDEMQIARFFTGIAYLYAVSFPGDLLFYELRSACEGATCSYSAESDTLVTYETITQHHRAGLIVRHVSQSLDRYYDPAKAAPYFSLRNIPDNRVSVGLNTFRPNMGASAISSNGKWALYEMKDMGIVRVNTVTGASKRVLPRADSYGTGLDPRYELAISNSGTEVITTGRNATLRFIEVNDTCGDTLLPGMMAHFAWNIISCTAIELRTGAYLPAYFYLTNPRFDSEATQLGFTANYPDNTSERFIVSPQPEHINSMQYVALGDSFSSGEGEVDNRFYKTETDQAPFKCHTSSRSYPYIVGAKWELSTQNVACSGAQTKDIIGGITYMGQEDGLRRFPVEQWQVLSMQAAAAFKPGVLAQREFVNRYQPSFVSIGIGGNDAGLVAKLTSCLSPGTCEWVQSAEKRRATAHEISTVFSKLTTTIHAIRQDAPRTKVVVIGYPQIISKDQNARCDMVTGALLDGKEREFIWETIHYLNQIVEAAAHAGGAAFIRTEESIKGHELCGVEDSSAMNGVRLGNDIAPIKFLEKFQIIGAESFHPTPQGHQLMADAITRTYESNSMVLMIDCSYGCPATIPAPSSYWDVQDPTVQYQRQRVSNSLVEGILQIGKVVDVRIPWQLFSSDSPIRIELHSEKHVLAKLQDERSDVVQVQLPRGVPAGYHTMHVIGTAPLGEELDVYQTVALLTTQDKEEGSTDPAISLNKMDDTLFIGQANKPMAVLEDTVGTTNVLGMVNEGVLGDRVKAHAQRVERSIDDRRESIGSIVLACIALCTSLLLVVLGVLWYRKHLIRFRNEGR